MVQFNSAHPYTTKFAAINAGDPVMTGDEEYVRLGDLISLKEAGELIQKCKGLNLYYDCLAKAKIVAEHFDTSVTLGACMVADKKTMGSYGFYYNPPYEFHAWVELSRPKHPLIYDPAKPLIVDLALPGLILKGNQMEDHMGPVIHKEPVILAGTPRKWMLYKAVRRIDRNTIQGNQAIVT